MIYSPCQIICTQIFLIVVMITVCWMVDDFWSALHHEVWPLKSCINQLPCWGAHPRNSGWYAACYCEVSAVEGCQAQGRVAWAWAVYAEKGLSSKSPTMPNVSPKMKRWIEHFSILVCSTARIACWPRIDSHEMKNGIEWLITINSGWHPERITKYHRPLVLQELYSQYCNKGHTP